MIVLLSDACINCLYKPTCEWDLYVFLQVCVTYLVVPR